MTQQGNHGSEPPAGDDPDREAARALAIDERLAGRYRVVRLLGAGGMGVVYEVFDQDLEESVALKLLHADLCEQEDHRTRLRGEVRMARRVSHPNVCRVHDLGEHQGQLFVTMELIRGASLRAQSRAQKREQIVVPLPRTVDIVVQVCSALAAAHRAGVLHRDVKPDNIILERTRVVLTDFGVAGLVADLAQNRRILAGTPAYIAPEVLRGERYDQRVDVYATAVMAYELIAGRHPFPTPSLDAAIQRARTRPAVPALPPEVAEPRIVKLLDQALAGALEFDATMRTRSMDALAEEIAHAVRGYTPTDQVQTQITSEANAPTLVAEAPEDGSEQPTITAKAKSRSKSSRRSSSANRALLRVATSLAFACEGAKASVGEVAENKEQQDHRALSQTVLATADRFERLVVDLGGTPIEVTESGITALFGAPITLGDDAARAARAAHALLECCDKGRAGIDTGRVLYRRGKNGASASGDAIEVARALLGDAEPGEVLASAPAARQLVGRFQVSELADQRRIGTADGRALRIDMGTLERAGAAQDALGPLLGRERELGQLEALVQAACETREAHWAAIVGPAGYGKSRLRAELRHRVDERREVEWLVGRAAPLGEVAPFSLLRSASPDWFAAATADGVADRRAAFAAARSWLEERAARRPAIVVFEDAQWADDASLDLCDELAQSLEQVPVVIVVIGRDRADKETFAGPAMPAERRLIIELGTLDSRSARELAHRVAPAASEDELRELARRAGGNPFFVEELARDLRERGRSQTGETSTISTLSTPLPATVAAVVQGRLDRLPSRARRVACAAAVVGREFWREAVAVAVPGDTPAIDDASLDRALAELEHRAIVSPLPPSTVDDERYVFSSELVRDVAYQQLSPRDRRQAHGAVAVWLSARIGAPQLADPAILGAVATHFDLAGKTQEARAAYEAAGRRSTELFAYHEAAVTLRRARELSPKPSAELLEHLGEALLAADSIQAAEEALHAALALVSDAPVASARILCSLSLAANERADNDASIEYGKRGLALLAPEGTAIDAAQRDPTVLAALYGSLGNHLGYTMADNEVGLPYCEKAVALLEGTPHRRALAQALSRLGGNYMRAGRWSDQLRCNQRCLELGEQLGDLDKQTGAHNNLGVTYSSLGRFQEAADHTRRALDLTRRTHSIRTRALVHSNLGGWLLELGRLEEAADHVRTAVEICARMGSRRFLSECYTFWARIALTGGDQAEAERRARQALAVASDTRASFDEGIAARILGGILALGGQLEQAQELLARSQACLAQHDDYESAKTTAQTARFFRLRNQPGDAERASALRAEAQPVFERLGASRDLERLDDDREVR